MKFLRKTSNRKKGFFAIDMVLVLFVFVWIALGAGFLALRILPGPIELLQSDVFVAVIKSV